MTEGGAEMARKQAETSFFDGCLTIIGVVFLVMLVLAMLNG